MLTLLALRSAGDWLLSLLERLPWYVWVLGVALAWGGVQYHRAEVAKEAAVKQAIASAETAAKAADVARTKEQVLNTRNQEISDALLTAQTTVVLAHDAVAQRLRKRAHASPAGSASAAAETACRSLDAPAVAIIPDATRDALVDLATAADQVSARLVACQAYVRNVSEAR